MQSQLRNFSFFSLIVHVFWFKKLKQVNRLKKLWLDVNIISIQINITGSRHVQKSKSILVIFFYFFLSNEYVKKQHEPCKRTFDIYSMYHGPV